LIYVWNGFSIIGKKMHLLEPMMASIEKTIQEVFQNKGQCFTSVHDGMLGQAVEYFSLSLEKHFAASSLSGVL
jgi:hypothetical protein